MWRVFAIGQRARMRLSSALAQAAGTQEPTSLTGRLSLQWMRSEGTPPNTGPVYAPCGKLGKKRKFDIKPCLWSP